MAKMARKQAAADVVKSRKKFLELLDDDIRKTDAVIDKLTEERNSLETLIENIKSLKIYPEHPALVPLGKRIYFNGKITHTGEYHVQLNAHPNDITLLQSSDQTIKMLKKRIKVKNEDIEKVSYSKEQLVERKELFEGGGIGASEGPKEIHSDKGVAVKVGEFYEILEYEE